MFEIFVILISVVAGLNYILESLAVEEALQDCMRRCNRLSSLVIFITVIAICYALWSILLYIIESCLGDGLIQTNAQDTGPVLIPKPQKSEIPSVGNVINYVLPPQDVSENYDFPANDQASGSKSNLSRVINITYPKILFRTNFKRVKIDFDEKRRKSRNCQCQSGSGVRTLHALTAEECSIDGQVEQAHQLLYHVQEHREQEIEEKDEVVVNPNDLMKQPEAEKSKFINMTKEMKTREEQLDECMAETQDCQKKYEKLREAKKLVEENNAKLKRLVAKLEENSVKFEKNVQKKEKIIKKNLYEIERLKLKISKLESDLSQTKEELLTTEKGRTRRSRERIGHKVDTITKFALNSQQKTEK